MTDRDAQLLAWLQRLAEAEGLPETSERARDAHARFTELIQQTTQPPGDRLLLTEYGRKCFDEGYKAGERSPA